MINTLLRIRSFRPSRAVAEFPSALELSILLLSSGVYVSIYLLFSSWTIDDAGITFAYSRNLAVGYGVVLYPGGERVEGYSDPLWVLLLASAYRLGFPLPLAAKILGGFFGVATIALAQQLSMRILGRERSLPCGIMLPLVAISVPFVQWTSSGLESALYSFLLVLAANLFVREQATPTSRPYSAAVLLAIAFTRPEGFLYMTGLSLLKFVGFPLQHWISALSSTASTLRRMLAPTARRILHEFIQGRSRDPNLSRLPARLIGLIKNAARTFKTPSLRRSHWWDLQWALIFLIPFFVYQYWHLQYFTYPLPNTYYAKLAGPNGRYVDEVYRYLSTRDDPGSVYVTAFFSQYNYAICLVGLLMVVRPKSVTGFLTALTMVTVTAFSALYVGGDWMVNYRFMVPAVAFLVILLEGGLDTVLNLTLHRLKPEMGSLHRHGKMRRLATFGLTLSILLASFVTLAVPTVKYLGAAADGRFLNMAMVENMGAYVRRNAELAGLEDEASLFTADIGGVAYSSGLRIVDMSALADVTLAQSRWSKAVVRNYIFSEARPTFIYIHDTWTAVYSIDRFPEFYRDYVPVNATSTLPYGVEGLFIRRDALETDNVTPEILMGTPLPPGVEVAGYNISHRIVAPGTSIAVVVYWRVSSPLNQDPTIRLSLGGRTLLERDIAYGWLPVKHWKPGRLIREYISASISRDFPRGTSDLQLGLQGLGGMGNISLGEVVVDELAAQHEVARLESDAGSYAAQGKLVEALRYARIAFEMSPGKQSLVDLKARIQQGLALEWAKEALELRSQGKETQAVALGIRASRMAGAFPMRVPPLENLSKQLLADGKALMTAGQYSAALVRFLEANTLNPRDPSTRHLAEEARAWATVQPGAAPIGTPVGAVFGGVITLAGADVSASPVAAGSLLRVVYYWRTLRPLARDYMIYVHLESQGKPILSGDDHFPLLPTARWPTNRTIVDERYIFVPYNAPVGNFTLWVGVWDRKDRLAVTEGTAVHDEGHRVRLYVGKIAGIFLPPLITQNPLPASVYSTPPRQDDLRMVSLPFLLSLSLVVLILGRKRRRGEGSIVLMPTDGMSTERTYL